MRNSKAREQVAAIDRMSTTWLAWLLLGALLAMLTLEAREVARRNAPAFPVIEVDASNHVIAGIPLEQLASPEAIVPTAAVAPAIMQVAPAQTVPMPVTPATPAATMAGERGLIGMDAATLRASLGAPDFVRRDGSSQMWRYGSGACTLTVFLHGADDRLAVEHVEGRGVRNPRDPSADCAGRLVGERRRIDLPG